MKPTIDAKIDVFNNFLEEYKSISEKVGLIDGWNQFRLICYEQMTGDEYSGGDIDRDFWKEWILYFGDGSETITGNVIDDHITGFKLFLEYFDYSFDVNGLVDLDFNVYNKIIEEGYSIFLPQTNLIFDGSVQSDGTFKDRLSGNLQTVYYPSLGTDYSWDGDTLTETDNNTAYNSYIGYGGAGAEVTFAGHKANADASYYKYNTNTETGETVETTTTASGTLVVSLAQYEAISNLVVDGVRYETLLYDGFVQVLTATNCVQLFVPSVKVETFPATLPLTFEETDVDVFGQDITDYLHLSGTIPQNAFINFDALTVDVFDRENTDFFDPNNLFMNDYDSENQRLFSVRNLVNPEKLRSVMYSWNIFSEKASDNSLKRVVAYSETTYDIDLKILKALKDTETDVIERELYANDNSLKLNEAGVEADTGEGVKEVYSIGSDVVLSQGDETKQMYKSEDSLGEYLTSINIDSNMTASAIAIDSSKRKASLNFKIADDGETITRIFGSNPLGEIGFNEQAVFLHLSLNETGRSNLFNSIITNIAYYDEEGEEITDVSGLYVRSNDGVLREYEISIEIDLDTKIIELTLIEDEITKYIKCDFSAYYTSPVTFKSTNTFILGKSDLYANASKYREIKFLTQ